MYVYTHVYLLIHVHIYIYTCVYIHLYIYIYDYICPPLSPQWYGLKGGEVGRGGARNAPEAASLHPNPTLKLYRTQSPGLKLACCSIIRQTVDVL